MDTVIKLSQPIELRAKDTGRVISTQEELRLRAPTAGDMVDAMDEAEDPARNRGSFIRALVCRCAGITRADFDALSIEDGSKLLEAIGSFLPNGQATGPTH